ncbi:hypothetical protein XENOCAPTIV_018894 [Xenoophorus captivus]|uniref:Uncharacterized protein n=1 Tax=Xenoophorus captivus TaxID=1517983 RepID=A0ABV0QK11_9TELE
MKRTTFQSTTTTSAMSKSTLAMRDMWTTSVKSTPLTYKNPPTQEDQSLWYVAVPMVLAALIIAVIAIIRWKKTKGNQGQIEERMAHDENGISYASIGFIKNTNNKSRTADTVTYSTVRAASSAAAVSIDPNSVYSTVN